MENHRMSGIPEAVVGGTEGGPSPPVRVLYGACWRQPEARASCTRSRLA